MAPILRPTSDSLSFAEIDITAALMQRPTRRPDYAAENRALVHVAQEMAARPASLLQTLVDTALALCRAGSAGISLLETHDGEAVFRWAALAGAYAVHRNGTMPRDASPCGMTIARNATQLLVTPGRVFPAVRVTPPIVECLLVPFTVDGRPIGTVWILAHDDQRKFDAEDARLVQTLAQFAAAGWQVWQAHTALEQRVAERTAAWHRELAERQRLERAAQQAAHFALLGRLAAGVSHEIRNPLSAIVLHVDLLDEELREQAPASASLVAESLTEIRTHLARLEDLVQDYLSLVRVGTMERTFQDLGAVLESWATEWQALAAARGVTLHLGGLADLGQAMLHMNTLRRALLNLVQNALDAMPQGGTLTVAAQGTATHVQIEVRDTGGGVPAACLPRLFEPLYTTKPGGTGLGLYIVQEIVKAHGGDVTVQSAAGRDTTFTVTLPRHAPAVGHTRV
jgi:signal transduction histidine kinase